MIMTKCPVCGKKLINGYVPSSIMKLQFVPGTNGKMPKTIFSLGKNAVQLSKMPVWVAAKAEARHCPECRIVIIPEFEPGKTTEETAPTEGGAEKQAK